MLRLCTALLLYLFVVPALAATDSSQSPAGGAPQEAASTKASNISHTIVISSDDTGKQSPSNYVPPGFEDLMQPQTTLVDIYYGDAYLMSVNARFTPTWITFINPDKIVAKIPDVLNPEEVAKRLASELPTNSEFVCLKSNETNCGKMKTDSVDVIFDESHFRADLFIAPRLLSVRPAVQQKFLPPSSAGLSLLNVVAAAVNGQSGGNKNYNIGNDTTIAYKENRLLAISNITQTEHLTFDTLALQRQINGKEFQAGIFRSSPGDFVFMQQENFQGISIGSSLDTRRDLDQSSGNALQVFLPSRSRVDILKDGRLISTGIYDTGNQIIDTSELPGGAYNVTLRIRDNFGNVREETRFYVKTSRLPPRDQPLYFFDVGELVVRQPGHVLPTGNGEQIFRTGITRRLTDNFGGEVGVLASNHQQLLETGFFKLGRSYDLRASYAHDNDGDNGASLNASLRFGRAVLNLDARKVWTKSTSPDAIMGLSVSQTSTNLSIPIGHSMLNFTSRYNSREGLPSERNTGIRLDLPTHNFGDRIFNSNIQVTKDNGEIYVLVGFKLTLNRGHWQDQISASYYHDNPPFTPTSNGMIGNLSSDWNDGDKYQSDVDLTLRANQERTDKTVESELNVDSDLGRYNLDGVYSLKNKSFNYGANFFTSIIADKDTFTFGGRSQAQSAAVINIAGNTRDAYFDVNVNGIRSASAQIGKKTVVGLAPFDTYKISLSPKGKSIVDFNDVTKTVTLYPGNVVSLTWKTKKILVAFGQIVDPAGKPVANALIKGVVGLATTDDTGLFQAELDTSTKSLDVKTLRSECRVQLPTYDTSQLVVTLNKLTCRK